MAKAKKTKRGEIKIAEPFSQFSKEMKANIEKMFKMAHKTIDKRLVAIEKYFEKSKTDKLSTKKPAKLAKAVKAKASKVVKKVKAKTSKVAKAVKAEIGNTPKKLAKSKKRAKQIKNKAN